MNRKQARMKEYLLCGEWLQLLLGGAGMLLIFPLLDRLLQAPVCDEHIAARHCFVADRANVVGQQPLLDIGSLVRVTSGYKNHRILPAEKMKKKN